MTGLLTPDLKQLLCALLKESLEVPLPTSTLRRVAGRTTLPGKATAVIGMRRAGKTTFLHQQRRERLDAGSLRESLPYLNFEDERLAGLQGKDLGYLIDEFHRQYPGLPDGCMPTWCFDEIQLVPGWERFVRRLLDSGGVQIFVTGSSAALLSREVASSLRGRAWEVPIYPFSFAEFLAHHDHELPERPEFLTAAQRSSLEHAFGEWLHCGGFPEAQGLDAGSRYQLLMDYVDVAMLRDVLERHGLSHVLGLRWLVRQLLGNAAAPFSVERFFSALKSQGIAIAKDTVHQMLAHLQDCFLVRTVWVEADSERQRMVNPRKAYPIDPGLIPVFDRGGGGNLGHALETAVLIELERRRCEVSYVKAPSGFEVDFFARYPAGGRELIQVCADASDPATGDRELRSLREAGERFPDATRRLLTLTHDGVPGSVVNDIVVQPAYEWMLCEGRGDPAE